MKKIVVFVAVICLVLSSCDFIKTKIFRKKHDVDTMASYQARMDSLRIADSIAAAMEQAKLDSMASTEAPATQEAAPANDGNKYQVISGSFRTPAYAEDWKQKMITQGYNAQILQASNGFNLVSIGGYTSYGAALKQVMSLMEQESAMQSWVYVAY